MMYPYHWLVTPKTPYADQIRVGSIVEVPDKGTPSPVYVLHRDSKKQTRIIGRHLIDSGYSVKTVSNGKIVKKIGKNSYTVVPRKTNMEKTTNRLARLSNAYRRLVSKRKISSKVNPLDRMIYVSYRHYKFLPCAKKYAWWLKS